jgi:Holliday junction DNA helicase RuvA
VRAVIVSLSGILVQADLLSVVVETGGIGYLVNVPLSASCKLPPVGSAVKLQIYAVYREDRRELYGFPTAAERDFFKLMVEKVSGIGPRSALNIMSKLSLPVLVDAVASGDAGVLAKCHGIGKKTAERMIVELADSDISAIAAKFGVKNSQPAGGQSGNVADAIAALLSLGYKAADAERAVQRAVSQLGESPRTEEIIRTALGS